MAWARVQSVSGNVLSATSKAVTFTTANVTAGNKLIVAASVDSSTQTFAASNPCWDGTHAFTLIGSALQSPSVRVSLWALDVPTGGVKPTITVTANSAGASIAVLAMEFSGLASGNTTAMGDGTFATTAGNNATPTAPTYSTTAANELLIEVIGDWGGSVTFTIPTGSTADANNINTSSTGTILAAWKNSANGSETMTYTVGASTAWGQVLGAFKLGNQALTQALSGGLSFTGSQKKATTRPLAAGASFTGSQTKATSKKITAALSFTGAQSKSSAKALAAALGFTGAHKKAVARPVSAALGFTGAVTRAIARPLSGDLSFTGSFGRGFVKSFTGFLGFTGSQSKATSKTLPAGLSFAGSANRAVRRTVSGALGFAGTTTKATARSLSGSLGLSGALLTGRNFVQNLLAALGFTGSVTKSTQRPLSASLSPSGAVARAITKNLPPAALSLAGSVTRSTSRALAGQLSFVGGHTKNVGKAFGAALSFVGDLASAITRAAAQIINVINPPVSGSVVAVVVVQLPGGPAIFYLLSYIPDEVPIGEVATFRVQLAGSDGTRPSPDLAPVMRVLDDTGAEALPNTTMTNASGVWSASWTPAAAGPYSVEVRTALSSNTIAAQIPVTVRPRFDPIALAVSDTLVSRF